MKRLTGVYLTDGVSKSGVRFSIPALEDALWQGFQQCVPSNISHDIHRPLGLTNISSLYLSHENAYLLGTTSIPETKEEEKQVIYARTAYLNNKIVERVMKFSQAFNEEIRMSGLLKENGRLMSNGVVMYGYKDIVFDAFPYLKELTDGDGLLYLNDILKTFEYKGDGVFASTKGNLSVMVHPYMRRSLSIYNCFNNGFLKELFDSNSEATPVRIRLDLDYVGYTPSFIETQEFDYWYGPDYSDDIGQIKEGVTAYDTNQTEYIFNQIKKTEFVWQNKDGKRQFEMEEVTDIDAPTLEEGTYGCRYLHSFYDPETKEFDHFDGAIRCYDLDSICKRLECPIDAMGHSAQYTKLFRIDGPLPIHKWKSLITHYLKGNQDVYRYFGMDVPFIEQDTKENNPVSKYVPFVPKTGDGIRILYSYHTLSDEISERFFTDFDTCHLQEGVIETADLMAVDLAKCIRRCGGEIEYPDCRYISYRDNFHDIPEIYHGGTNTEVLVGTTLKGINLFLTGLRKRKIDDCLSFCLSWNVEGRKVKISFMGSVTDLLKWLSFMVSIPTGREGLKKWLDKQTTYVEKNGCDAPTPINAAYIHSNGIFYHRRRLVQQDAELKDLYMDAEKGVCASLNFNDGNKELIKLFDSKIIKPVPYIVVDKLLCNCKEDYLKNEKIASLGEIECETTIYYMNLIWSSQENGFQYL